MLLVISWLVWACIALISLDGEQVSSAPGQQHPFNKVRPDPPRRLYGRFLHFTDLHPDQYYTPGSSVNDACHKQAVSAANKSALTIESDYLESEQVSQKSRGKKSGHKKVGHYGAPASVCDSPRDLIESSLQWLSDNWMANTTSTDDHGKGIDYIIWTGDTARHDIDATHPRNAGEIFDYNRWVLSLVEKRFPGIPIVPNLGNNDIIPHNIMFPGPNLMTTSYADIWKDHIPSQQYETFRQGGYYAKEVIEGDLAVISMNTLYWFNSNAAVRGCKGKNDPGSIHLRWLERTLSSYRNRSMQVQLIGHVPPISNNLFENCYDKYTDLTLRYQDTIVGQHFGHMNIDAWYLQKDPDARRSRSRSVSEELADQYLPIYTAPSIVPTYLPSIRVWSYNTTREAKVEWQANDIESLSRRKAKKHKKLQHHVSPYSPSRSNTYLSLLGYSQWVLDLDKANKRYRKEVNESIPHSMLNYQLQYTTYSADILWRSYIEGSDRGEGHRPVPKHLLDLELQRRKVGPPVEESVAALKRIKVPRKLRHLTRYSIPSFTVNQMLDWAEEMISCKKLSKKTARKHGRKGRGRAEGFCRMKGGGFLYKTNQID